MRGESQAEKDKMKNTTLREKHAWHALCVNQAMNIVN